MAPGHCGSVCISVSDLETSPGGSKAFGYSSNRLFLPAFMARDALPSNTRVAGFRVELFRSAQKACSSASNSRSLGLAAAESQHESAEQRSSICKSMLPDKPFSEVLSVQQKAFHSFKVCARQSALESQIRIIDRRAYFLLLLGAVFCLLLAVTIAMGTSLWAIYTRGVGESHDFSAAPSLLLILFHTASAMLDPVNRWR